VTPGGRKNSAVQHGTWIGDAGQRYPRMASSSEVIKGLWTNSDFKFDGTFYRAHVRRR